LILMIFKLWRRYIPPENRYEWNVEEAAPMLMKSCARWRGMHATWSEN